VTGRLRKWGRREGRYAKAVAETVFEKFGKDSVSEFITCVHKCLVTLLGARKGDALPGHPTPEFIGLVADAPPTREVGKAVEVAIEVG
jgi:hypothetical protein